MMYCPQLGKSTDSWMIAISMANTGKNTGTNWEKLVGWDLEVYNDMSDEPCLICLTEKEMYVLGQSTGQIKWITRWDNLDSGINPDFDALSSRLDKKMSVESCIDFCQEIINCIENPESGVSDAIVNLIGSNSYGDNRELGQSVNDSAIGGGSNPTCDLDVLWAQCYGLVETLDTYNREFFAKLEAMTNVYEFISDVIGDITFIDETSVDALLAWVNKLQDDIAENYDAQSTLTYRQDVACEIFCAVQNNISGCDITPRIVFDVFKDRLSSSVSIEQVLSDTLDYLVGGAWSGTQIADFMFMSQAGFRSQLGRFLQYVGWNSLDSIVRLYVNDANNDWELLCTDCGWTWTSEFDVSENIWGVFESSGTSFGTWSASVGYETVDVSTGSGGYSRIVSITSGNFAPTYIKKIQVNYDLVKGSYSLSGQATVQIRYYRDNDTFVVNNLTNVDASNGSDLTRVVDVNEGDIKRIELYIRSSAVGSPSYSGSAKLNYVTISGQESNPFE